MRTRILFLIALVAGAFHAETQAQSTAITYQGRLQHNGAPATGNFDLQFTLFDQPANGTPLSGSVGHIAVPVSNGLFTLSLNFGPAAFTGADRWLEIAARPAGSGSFTTLAPRQPLTPTPYALSARTALNVPGISGSVLHAPNGGPQNAVVVDNTGKVGVGTTTPTSQLHVASKPNDLAPRLQSTGTADFNAGWDFYHGSIAKGYVGVPGEDAGIARRELILFGGQETKTSLWAGGDRGLTVHPGGNVGIGTSALPLQKFEVKGDARVRGQLFVDGDLRIGPNDRFRAASGDESLRMVRGYIRKDGTIAEGSGFRVTRHGKGVFEITFDGAFAGPPVLTATTDRHSYPDLENVTVLTSGAPRVDGVRLLAQYPGGTLEDVDFGFIAIGPR